MIMKDKKQPVEKFSTGCCIKMYEIMSLTSQ